MLAEERDFMLRSVGPEDGWRRGRKSEGGRNTDGREGLIKKMEGERKGLGGD